MDTYCDELAAILNQLPRHVVSELAVFAEQLVCCDQQARADMNKDIEDMAAAIELGLPEFRKLKLRTEAARRLQEAMLRNP